MPDESSDGVIDGHGDVSDRTPNRGGRSFAAILPNGRTIWLQVDSPLAPVRAVGNLGQLAEHTARWRSASVQTQSNAIARLFLFYKLQCLLGSLGITFNEASQPRARLVAFHNK